MPIVPCSSGPHNGLFSLLNGFRRHFRHLMCKNEDMGVTEMVVKDTDWTRVASQVLRALRGKRSQIGFSRRLGYRSNVACDWEASRRFPTAAEALRAARRIGRDVHGAFAAFQPACASALGEAPPYQVHTWLRELAGSMAVAELAARSGISRFAIARWREGTTKPRLPDFLALVEAISGRASDLVHALVSIEQVPELRAVHAQRAAAKRLAFDLPWTAAVMRVLESEGYRKKRAHPPGYIAARLGLTHEQESELLERLVVAGVARLERGRYEVGTPLTVDTQASPADMGKLKAHWSQVGLTRALDPQQGDWIAFNVISTSAADLERIREVLRHAFREIRAIAAASESEAVALLNLQLVTWNEQNG
jgi:transcriptional regulator with XRE-family HTH domain